MQDEIMVLKVVIDEEGSLALFVNNAIFPKKYSDKLMHSINELMDQTFNKIEQDLNGGKDDFTD